MERLKIILEDIDDIVDKPFVTSRFGDLWKNFARNKYDIDTIINIAWIQGRRAILLERVLAAQLKHENNCIKPDVIQQRELLVAFAEWFKDESSLNTLIGDETINKFLATNSA